MEFYASFPSPCDFIRKLVISDEDSPAEEISFSEAHLVAIASGRGSGRSFVVAFQRVTLNSVDAPRSFAGFALQTHFLRVGRENGELRFDECT